MTGSAIPAALDALVALWTGSVNGLQVVDGPVWNAQNFFLAVGWDRSEQPAVAGRGDPTDLRMEGEQEVFDVSCLLSLQLSTGGVSAARLQLFAAFAALRAALTDDPTLGDVVDSAAVTDREYTPGDPQGAELVDLRFTVHVEAFI